MLRQIVQALSTSRLLAQYAFPLSTLLFASNADAQTEPQFITVSVRDTLDGWDAATGTDPGTTVMNKLQISATVDGAAFNADGLRLHGQLFRTDGESLTRRTRDIQTISNIEAPPVTRLFELWAEQRFGKAGPGAVSIRVGLLDLNSEFDSIAPASLMINSSHGVGPDLSRSGLNGPSIFPVSSAGARADWQVSSRLTVRAAVFDGVPGDADNPKAFAVVALRPRDGILSIAEADFNPTKKSGIAIGSWRYSAPIDRIDKHGRSTDAGIYVFAYAPLGSRWTGWLRVGHAAGSVQAVDGYLGAGIAGAGIVPSRHDDMIGIAMARASIGSPAGRVLGLPRQETSIEATYRAKLIGMLTVQPDLQYVIDPALVPHAKNALVFGLRLVVTGNYPKSAPPADQADPTIAPDAPDQGSSPSGD
jgi:porin